MCGVDSILERFDISKADVVDEVRRGFFDSSGSLRMTESEVYGWVSDRALDEYKLAYQLSYLMQRCGHLLPAHFTQRLAAQVADETRHYTILSDILPPETKSLLLQRLFEFPSVLENDTYWNYLKARADAGSFHEVILELNVVHEGYAEAAIEVLLDLPIPAVVAAYTEIQRDERRHHLEGREFLSWLLSQAEQRPLNSQEAVATVARPRSTVASSMAWSWPSPMEIRHVESESNLMAELGEYSEALGWSPAMEHLKGRGNRDPFVNVTGLSNRSKRGTSMAWSWPAPAEKHDSTASMDTADLHMRAALGTSLAWSWPNPKISLVEKLVSGRGALLEPRALTGTSMAWSWPIATATVADPA